MKKFIAFIFAFVFVASFINFATAEEAKDGLTVFKDAKCVSCHGIEALKVEPGNKKTKAPDLSKFGDEGKTAEWTTKYITKEEKLNDKAHPVAFKGSPEDLKLMVDWLLTLKAAK